MNDNKLINIALNSTVTFSSTSPWSHKDDNKEILTAEHNREFSFHTDFEQNPYVLLNLKDIYIIHSICIYNRRNLQNRANKIRVEISLDNKEFEVIHSGFVYFSDKIEFNLNNLKKCKYVKISLDDTEALHLRKIEVFVDRNIYKVLNVTKMHSTVPPTYPPKYLYNKYTFDGKIPMQVQYFDNTNNSINPSHNTKLDYEKFFSKLDKRIFDYYNHEGKAFFEVIKKYNFIGKNVTIWGLAGLNLEAFSLWAGANNVYVVEYNKPIIDLNKIRVFDNSEFKLENVQSDIAISYSSFEHDGLGRYGDPLNPTGDIIAMQNAHDHLSEEGILLLGLPLGPDCLVWNAHRIYGKLRLPRMLKNFKLLDVFSVYGSSNPISFETGLGHHKQCILVLKKINEEYPKDYYLLSKKSDGGRYIDNNLFNKINKFIYDYKHSEE